MAPLAQVAVQLPEGRQRDRQSQAVSCPAALRKPGKRHPEVFMIVLATGQPSELPRPLQLWTGLFRESQHPRCVPVKCPRQLPALLQLLEGELADGFWHQEADLAARTVVATQQALVEQRRHAGKHVGSLVERADVLRGVEREASGEHSEAAKQRPLVIVEEGMAPFDRGAHGPLALRHVACTADQQVEPAV